MSGRSICVVILNWNQPELTGRCLDHVLQLEGEKPRILIVDNGSTLENRHLLKETVAGRAQIFDLPDNLGFAGGMNAGIRETLRSEPNYIWLLNNDAFPEPDCLVELLKIADRDQLIVAITPRLSKRDHSDHIVGVRLDWLTGEQHALYSGDFPRTNQIGYVIVGTAPLIRTAALRLTGGFDERFFAYREEDDLWVRILRRTEGLLAVAPAAHCTHLEHGSTEGKHSAFIEYMFVRNGWLILAKHLPARLRMPVLFKYASRKLHSAASRPEMSSVIVGALWAAVWGVYHKPSSYHAPRLVHWMALAWPRVTIGLLSSLSGWLMPRDANRILCKHRMTPSDVSL